MSSEKLPPHQPGDLQQITKLTKKLRMNGGKGYSYAYVKAVLDEKNPRKNDDIEGLSVQLRQMRKATIDALSKRHNKRPARG